MVTGYIQVPVYAASKATITLSHINGTVGSPCGAVFGASQASQTVQIRQGSSPHACLMSAVNFMQGRDQIECGEFCTFLACCVKYAGSYARICHDIF